MNKRQVYDKINTIINENELLKKGNSINNDTNLFAEAGLDSIGIVELVVAIEEEFGFEFDESELEFDEFATIDSIANLIQKKVY